MPLKGLNTTGGNLGFNRTGLFSGKKGGRKRKNSQTGEGKGETVEKKKGPDSEKKRKCALAKNGGAGAKSRESMRPGPKLPGEDGRPQDTLTGGQEGEIPQGKGGWWRLHGKEKKKMPGKGQVHGKLGERNKVGEKRGGNR